MEIEPICLCGACYEIGFHGIMNSEVVSFYYCKECWNKRN